MLVQSEKSSGWTVILEVHQLQCSQDRFCTGNLESFWQFEKRRECFSRRVDFDRCTMVRIPTGSVYILEAVSHRTRGQRSLWLLRVERCWSDSPLMRFIAALAGKQSSQQVLLIMNMNIWHIKFLRNLNYLYHTKICDLLKIMTSDTKWL